MAMKSKDRKHAAGVEIIRRLSIEDAEVVTAGDELK